MWKMFEPLTESLLKPTASRAQFQQHPGPSSNSILDPVPTAVLAQFQQYPRPSSNSIPGPVPTVALAQFQLAELQTIQRFTVLLDTEHVEWRL